MALSPELERSTTGWAGAFADDPSAVPVDIYLSGVRYPGEAVFTEFWNARWGGAPGQDAMFRIVFLGSSGTNLQDEIDDDRVVVVAPSGDMSPDLRPVAKEAAALRETRAGYAISSDPSLSQLARAIEVREGELASQVPDSMGKRWATGDVIARGERPDLTTLLPTLERSGADTWIEALGTWVIERGAEAELLQSTEPLTDELVASVFDLVAGRTVDPGPQVRAASAAIGLGGVVSSQISRFNAGLDALLDSDGESDGTALTTTQGLASGFAVRSLVTSTLRMPLELGALYLVDYVRRHNAEAVLVPVVDAGLPERINRDTLPDMTWDPRLLQRLFTLRSIAPTDWNSALPYLSAIFPSVGQIPVGKIQDDSESTGDSADLPDTKESRIPEGLREPQIHDRYHAVEALMEEMEAQASRVAFTALVIARLERAIGTTSNWNLDRLVKVLNANTWSNFADLARETFENARNFRVALARERTARGLSMRSRDLEETVAFLDTAEFGVEQRPLELEARVLRARFSAGLLDDSDGLWPALSSDFDRWRADYRRAYLSMHSKRPTVDEERQQRLSRAIMQLAAIEQFAKILELGAPQDTGLTQRYEELAESLEPCTRLEHDLSLISQPSCDACGKTLSSSSERPDIDGYLFELESVLRSYNRRLSSVAVREALADRQPERLSMLFKLRDAADLSALSDHLGNDVIDFLREFLAESDSQE
jgi:hypothetical protein